jgi:putative cell wall-binding protein
LDTGATNLCTLSSDFFGQDECTIGTLASGDHFQATFVSTPPEGYLTPSPANFTVDSSTCDENPFPFCADGTAQLTVPGTWRQIGLHVTDATTGRPVQGATYVLCAPTTSSGSSGGGCPSGTNEATSATTDASGDLTFPGLYQGSPGYAVVATNVPDGYTAGVESLSVPAVTDASEAGTKYVAAVTLGGGVPQGPTAPNAPAGATDAYGAVSTSPAGSATASSKDTSVLANGVGTFTVSQFPHNPTREAPPLTGRWTFFDVRTGEGSSFSSVTVKQCGLSNDAHSLVWFDGGEWLKASPVTFANGCVTLTVTDSSSPSLDDLSDALFAVGALPASRLAGSTRIGTAVAVSQERFVRPLSAGAVVLARADAYPDALAGDPLAAAKNAPLLLTDSTSLAPKTLTEMKRVLPPGSVVYILGGRAALSPPVAHAVTAAGFKVKRISGQDRYGTALAIAHALGNPATVFEVPGTGFADALSAAPAAGAEGAAILLTNGSTQSSATAGYLAHHPAAKRYAIGGLAAIADPEAVGISGSDRYATSANVADEFFSAPRTVDLATGENFPDALAGGAITDAPLLLVPGDRRRLPQSTISYLQEAATTAVNLRVLGGTSVLSSDLVSEAQRLLQ